LKYRFGEGGDVGDGRWKQIKGSDEVVEVAGLSLQHLKEAARDKNG